MGLAVDTLRQHFPRTGRTLRQHHAMIDRLVSNAADRATLKASANMLAIVAAEEASALKEKLGAFAKAAGPVVDLLKAFKR